MKKILLLVVVLAHYHFLSGKVNTLTKDIDRYFLEVQKRSPAPGFSVVVVKGDKVIFEKGYGFEQEGGNTRLSVQSSIAIGSLTKSMTALCILQLTEQGKVSLDDPVTKYLPEFKTANKELSDRITVRMLLNNTSGLPGGVTQRWIFKDKSIEKLVQSLDAIYLKREPGTSYEYSNTAFSVAGLIIQRVSGMSYSQYLKENLFRPLEMNRSTTSSGDFDELQVLYGHHPGEGRAIPADRGVGSLEMIPAGSMLRSSASDLGHYLVALLDRGIFKGKRILSAESIEMMWTPQVNFPGLSYDQGGDGRDYQYGLGWMISEVEGRTLIHHGGSTGTMSSMTVLVPAQGIAASVLFNIDYNFVDRYRFPSELSILNNLFHLVQGEEETDFGNPRKPDPSINDYKLPAYRKSSLTGSYRFSGNGDARNFQGTTLEIIPESGDRLKGEVRRAEKLISDFSLDFVNEAYAVSRNMASPRHLRFKIRPDGTVTGLFIDGSEFIKLPTGYYDHFQEISLMNGSFYFPKVWKWKIDGKKFRSLQSNDAGLSIVGGEAYRDADSLGIYLQRHYPATHVMFSGREIDEMRGDNFWRQQCYMTKTGGKLLQHLVLVNETTGFYLILATPEGRLTELIQTDICILMDSFAGESVR